MQANMMRWIPYGLVAGVALLLWLLQPILAPFLIAVALSYLGDPLVDRLEGRGYSRSVAVSIVFLALTLLFILNLLVAIPLLLEQAQLLLIKLREVLLWFQETALPDLRSRLGLPAEAGVTQLLQDNWGQAGGVFSTLWAQVTGRGMALTAWMINAALVPVVTFYLLRDWDIMVAKIRDALPRRYEPKAIELAVECDEIIAAFVKGQFLVMAALGIIYIFGLWMVGLQLAIVLGTLAGLASIVPYMGFVVGITAAGIAAWFQFYDWWVLLQVALVFGFGQMIESMFLTPVLVGDRVGLHPVLVIFAVMAGGQLFGFTGILLGLPGAAVLAVFVRHAYKSYRASNLYQAPPVPPPAPPQDPGEELPLSATDEPADSDVPERS